MTILRNIPLFAYILILYNVVSFMGSGDGAFFDSSLFEMALISGANVKVDINSLFVILGVIALFIEILKSTRASSTSILDHALSTVVLIVFLVEFIVVQRAGTVTFLVLTVMSLIDVIAGFTVTIASARRDIALDNQ